MDPLTHGAIHAAFSHVARALAAERPVVLALEDLHLAPAGGLVLFAALARLVFDHRILLIGTACPGLPDAWRTPLVDAEATTCLPLSRLGPRDLAALLENAFQSERLAHELGVGIGEKSDGNPFFVFEIIRGLRDGLFLQQREDGTWTTTGAIDDIQVPASVRDLVNARVAGLEEAERDLLDMASVAGFRFDPLVIAEAMGEPPMRVLKQLAQIERGHRLVRAAGATYVFDHQQIHEALYTSLSGPLRATYHDALGGALTALAVDEPVAICEHFLRGGSDEKADVHLDAALDRLDRRHRAEEVSDLISRVLSHVGVSDAARRGGLLLRRAEALAHLGRREEQRASLEEAAQALEGLAESELHVRVANANARLCWMTGGLVEAQAHLDRARDLARRVRDASGELESLGARGLVLLALGRYDDAGDAIEEALAFAEALGDAAGIARAQANLGVLALRRGRYEEALERLERHLSLVRDAQDRTMEGKTLSNLATVHRILGRYEEARALCAQHLELAQGIGDRHGEGTALWGLGVVAFARGRYDEAQQLYERRQSLSREIGDALGVAMCSAELGNVAVVQGRYADARGFLEASLAQATAMGSTSLGVAALASLGILDYYEGRFADARMRQEKTLALMREMGDRGREAGVIGTLGSIDHAEGRLRDALERQSRRRALSKDAGDRTGEALGCVGLGAVLRDLGRTREARELHVEALALAREAGNAREEAQAHFELGLDARQEGNLPRARARLDAARTAYRALGDQAQVDALLAIADLALSQEEWDEATRVLADASEMACTVENPAAVVTVAGLRALLPEGDVAAARGALEAREARLAVGVRLRMRYLLWTADGRVQDLVEAKALLDLLIENAPPEDRASLGENVPLCRDVAQAWTQHGAAPGGSGAV